ncbi:unnamed protein product [Lactuca virosa]|uniref:Uncharacterized protein n=1 Tax=Lactuca virosa TaxID=75947 RepID=A0AAU9NA59_9ASTR|nr:unnamed protein product [Lactuca virosa]
MEVRVVTSHHIRSMEVLVITRLMVAIQTHHIVDSGGDADYIDWIAIFEKVLGARRGCVRGIGPKPPSAAGTSA